MHLALARRSAGLTQREISERAGIGRPTLANIEKGRQRVLYHQFLDIARKPWDPILVNCYRRPPSRRPRSNTLTISNHPPMWLTGSVED